MNSDVSGKASVGSAEASSVLRYLLRPWLAGWRAIERHFYQGERLRYPRSNRKTHLLPMV